MYLHIFLLSERSWEQVQIFHKLCEHSKNARFREKCEASISFLPHLSILHILLFVGFRCPGLSFLLIEHQPKTSVFICLYFLIDLFFKILPRFLPIGAIKSCVDTFAQRERGRRKRRLMPLPTHYRNRF